LLTPPVPCDLISLVDSDASSGAEPEGSRLLPSLRRVIRSYGVFSLAGGRKFPMGTGVVAP